MEAKKKVALTYFYAVRERVAVPKVTTICVFVAILKAIGSSHMRRVLNVFSTLNVAPTHRFFKGGLEMRSVRPSVNKDYRRFSIRQLGKSCQVAAT